MKDYPIVELVDAALAGFVADLPASHDLEATGLAVESSGDALRLGLDLPDAVARWLRELSPDALAHVVEHARASLASAPIPGSATELEQLEVVTSRRDRSESVVVSVRRASMAAGRLAGDIEGFSALVDDQKRLVEALAQHVSRQDAENALGIRRGLLVSGSWTNQLREGTEAPADIVLDVSGADVPASARPADQAVVGYIQHGDAARWVEGFATAHAEFAEELADGIDVMRSAGETVGLAARRWQASRDQKSSSSSAAVVVPIRFGLKAAAADVDSEHESTVQLGRLAPAEAQASLTVAGGRVTLSVFADSGSLTAVQLGKSSTSAESEDGVWQVSEAWSEEPLLLVVEDNQGRRFETALVLGAGPDSSP